jgi:hypothetical protein
VWLNERYYVVAVFPQVSVRIFSKSFLLEAFYGLKTAIVDLYVFSRVRRFLIKWPAMPVFTGC